MEIAAAEAEGAHSRAAGMMVARQPGAFFRIDVERSIAGGHFRQRSADLYCRRQDFVVQCKGRLNETGRAGGRFRMPDLGFHRTERAPGTVGFTVHLAQCADFDGVSHFRARSVSLNQFNGVGGHVGRSIGGPEGFLLSLGAGGVNGFPFTVAAGAYSADDCIDPVPVTLGIDQPFQDDHSEPFTEGGPVSPGIEGPCITAWRQGRGFAEAHVHEDVVEGVDTSRHHHVGPAGCKFQAGHVDGAERAGARGIYDAVGSAEIQLLTDPSSHDVAEKPGERSFLPWDI